MVVDTSALLAILLGEPERDRFIALLAQAEDPLISAATLVEASIVMQARIGEDGVGDLDDLLAAAAVRTIAVDADQAQLARAAFARFGKGHAPAGLNFGDCFAYALAQALDRPLLFTARTSRRPTCRLRLERLAGEDAQHLAALPVDARSRGARSNPTGQMREHRVDVADRACSGRRTVSPARTTPTV